MSAAMAVPLALMAVGGAAKAGAGIAQARTLYTKQDAAKLARLRARQEATGLGLTEANREGLENELLTRSGAVARTNADQSDRIAAQLAAQGALSGRDLFMQEALQQQTQAQLQTEAGRVVREADKEAADRQRELIAQLRDQREMRKAATLAAIFGGVGATASGAGEISLEWAQGKQATGSQKRRTKLMDKTANKNQRQGVNRQTAEENNAYTQEVLSNNNKTQATR